MFQKVNVSKKEAGVLQLTFLYSAVLLNTCMLRPLFVRFLLTKQGGEALPRLLSIGVSDSFQLPAKLLTKSLSRIRVKALLAMLLVYPFVS